jgi:hypothetical protein
MTSARRSTVTEAQLVSGHRLRDASTVGYQSIIREDRIPHSALEVSLPNFALCAIRGVSYAGSLEDAFIVSARALPAAQGVERVTLRIPELFSDRFCWTFVEAVPPSD